MMYGLPWWLWFLLGMVPYALKRQASELGGYTLELRALFWSMTIRILPMKSAQWVLNIGAIQRLRDMTQKVLHQLTQTDDDDPTPLDSTPR
jgi:hypothetical protein